jgi:hypothetical protein
MSGRRKASTMFDELEVAATELDAATDGEWPPLRLVQLRICQACLDGEGAECHTPGCALWLHSVGPRIHRELYEIVSADPPADGIDLDLCGGCGDTCVIWRGGATLYVDDPCAWMVEDDPRGGKSWVFDCKNQDPRDERPSATPPPDPGQKDDDHGEPYTGRCPGMCRCGKSCAKANGHAGTNCFCHSMACHVPAGHK